MRLHYLSLVPSLLVELASSKILTLVLSDCWWIVGGTFIGWWLVNNMGPVVQRPIKLILD